MYNNLSRLWALRCCFDQNAKIQFGNCSWILSTGIIVGHVKTLQRSITLTHRSAIASFQQPHRTAQAENPARPRWPALPNQEMPPDFPEGVRAAEGPVAFGVSDSIVDLARAAFRNVLPKSKGTITLPQKPDRIVCRDAGSRQAAIPLPNGVVRATGRLILCHSGRPRLVARPQPLPRTQKRVLRPPRDGRKLYLIS
jgi:hypothetical protein